MDSQFPWYKKLWSTKWMRNTTIGVSIVLLTVLAFLGQQYGEWLGASLVGIPTCVQDSGKIVVFPVSGVLNSFTEAEISKAIEDKKISSIHGKHYSNTPDQLKASFTRVAEAADMSELSTIQSGEYQSGAHIGIDIPVWWMEQKDNVPIISPFQQAQVYRIFTVEEGSNTWGNGITLCYSNGGGTYFAHFAHMKDAPLVKEGDIVSAGQQLGIVGNTGQSYGAHVHFQINKYARYNPFYTTDPTVMRTTFIDPLLLMVKSELAYGGNVLVAGPEPTTNNLTTASILDLSLTPSKSSANVGESVKVSVNAKDQSGNPASGKILIASSVPVGLPSEKEITNGSDELVVTSSEAQSVKLTVSDKDGKVSKEVTISFNETETTHDSSNDSDTADTDSSTTETTQSNNVRDIFSDISSVSSSEQSAIQYLWDNSITTGCGPDTFCPNDSLNRAAAATFLIRALYPQIDLEKVTIGAMPFTDVDVSAWYAAPIYVANLSSYNGIEKPVFIKGSDGKAMPASSVKLEEFSAMILRVLKVEVPETEAWYDGYLTKMTQLSLISQSEASSYLGKSIPRKMVARILHQAVLWHQSNPNGLVLTEAEKTQVVNTAEEEVVKNPDVDAPQNLQARLSNNGQVILEWLSSATPNTGYVVVRKTANNDFVEISRNITSPMHVDLDAQTGETYIYKVQAEELTTGKVSTYSNETSVKVQ